MAINIKPFLASLTSHPGVYQMLDEYGKILYVGKARNLKKRLASYFSASAKDIKTQSLLKHVKDINVVITRNENEALLLECNLIKKYRPHYNVLFRDDKSYPYIVIKMEHPYPCIDFYRGHKNKKDGMYFGPYPNSTAVRETISYIQKLFRLRTCSDKYFATRKRPCLEYQINRCSGACAGLISPEDYQQDIAHTILFLQGKNQELITELTQQMEESVKTLNFELAAELRDQIRKMRELQERQYVSTGHGDVDIIVLKTSAGIICIQLLIIRNGRILGSRSYFPETPPASLHEEIITSFITQHYLSSHHEAHDIPKEIILEIALPDAAWLASTLSEKAERKIVIAHNVRSERKKWLEMASSSAMQAVISRLVDKTHTRERFVALQKLLHLDHFPDRIECFDISHTMGEATVASCVVFNANGPLKSDYRRFNITDVTPGDDIAAMKQVLGRRYKKLSTDKEQAIFPDIILIDGGKTQLAAAEAVLTELHIQDVIVIGVAKGATRKAGLETLHRRGQAPFSLPADSLVLHLIQQIRDEAHRFAITGHRQRRDKKRHTSTLETIPGIGAKRRRELLRYFGGIQAINRASLDELANVPGISESLAQRIFDALHLR